MIIRLSQKLHDKLKSGPLETLPLHENPLVDWSAHLFTAKRAPYILLSNTKSLYSIVMHGRGLTSDSLFMERTISSMQANGQALLFQRWIVPAADSVRFARALSRSVTAMMNDLVKGAKYMLEGGGICSIEVGLKLNQTPLSALKLAGSDSRSPNEVFKAIPWQTG